MKIIGVDNLCRDTVSDIVVAENVSEVHAQIMVDALNEKLCFDSSSSTFYVLKSDNYVPYEWEP